MNYLKLSCKFIRSFILGQIMVCQQHIFIVILFCFFFHSLTWDEHLFEIVLPRPCCVGHVDLKFTLHPGCTLRPDVQVTLLKQNITSIGRQTNGPSVDVDKVIDFNFVKSTPSSSSSGTTTKTDKVTNRVLDPSFSESHNAEILCGPINISSCLDLSGNGGLITLTSPQLLVSKPKAFLLHVKGFIQNGGKSEEKCEKQKVILACSNIHLYKVQVLMSQSFHV